MTTGVVLLTRDLRRHDNPALAAAARDLDRVVPLFVFDPHLLAGGHSSANRLAFLLDSLADLDQTFGDGLVTRTGDPVEQALRVAAEAGATVIDLTADVSGYARRREARLRRSAAAAGIRVRVHPGVAVVEAGQLVPAGSDHFAVFTPFYRRWLAALWRPLEPLPARLRIATGISSEPWPDRPSNVSRALPQGGETNARMRLDRWLAEGLAGYAVFADDLAADATSRLSPYLHLGCVSPLETARRALAVGGPGAEAFVRQLCWRDFHLQVLAARPDLPTADYRARGDPWRDDPDAFDRWRAGRTGVPIVDAALTAAVVCTGLAPALSGSTHLTVFAPNNAAFAKLGLNAGNVCSALPKATLTNILLYHATAGDRLAASLLPEEGETTTVNTLLTGQSFRVTSSARILTSSGGSSRIVATDIRASNGVIHVIDTVLIPGAKSDQERDDQSGDNQAND